MNTREINNIFDFESMKYDKETSRFYFKKQFDDPEDAMKFKNNFQDFLHSFVKDEAKIPEALLEKVKEEIESKRDEFETHQVNFTFDGARVFLVGKKKDVAQTKQFIVTMVDRFEDEAQMVSTDLRIKDKNKLKFLNFIDYFGKLMTEFPKVRIQGSQHTSEKLTLLGTAAITKDVELKIYKDTMGIYELDVKTSVHQIDCLRQTQCQIVNNELKKDDAMLMLMYVEIAVDAKVLQAKIMTLKKCDDNEVIKNSNVTEMK